LFRHPFAPLAAFAVLAVSAHVAAGTCTPVRVGPHVMAQPEAWRHAVEALIRSTAEDGLPWSCGGGEVDLVVRPEGATLTVTDATGHAIAREVATPDDVQPLGEALLARPLGHDGEPRGGSPNPSDELKAAEPKAAPAEAEPDPRVLLSAVIAPRFAGGANVLWGGVAAGAAIPFGPWGAGIWFRYDGPIASFSGPQPSMQDVAIGATAFRGFGVGPLTLRAALKPSLGIVLRKHEHSPDLDTHLTPRIGAEAQAMIPVHRTFRALVGFDAEIAPLDVADHAPPPGMQAERVSRYPAYTLGLHAGLEVAIR
jgi:hypothetical protein